jgi:DNA-binding transcriptional MerR regulator
VTSTALSIGEFARSTHVSVKMLRHYHQIGLLEPADVDPETGYRRYTADQIPPAQVIRRFRDLDMPLDRIKEVLGAADLETRNRLIAEHLDALQSTLAQTQAAVSSLRDLLESPMSGEAGVGFRKVEATQAAAITDKIKMTDAGIWFPGAIGEIYATLAAQDLPDLGAAGGIYADELFADEEGLATIFVPYSGELRATGRVAATIIPAVELATIVHVGSHSEIDRSYGALGAYVARHALSVDGPIREYYLVGTHDTRSDESWRTEIGWPIFRTDGAS